MPIDYSLYLVTDRGIMSTQTLTEAVEQAILGGCTMVQLREKVSSSLDFYEQAQEVKRITDRYEVPLIINDRVDIALKVKAAGVHIGQSDLPVPEVRRLIGPEMLLGVSVSSLEEAGQARRQCSFNGRTAENPTHNKSANCRDRRNQSGKCGDVSSDGD